MRWAIFAGSRLPVPLPNDPAAGRWGARASLMRPLRSCWISPGTHQDLDVPRDSLKRNVERRRELGHEQCLVIQPLEDPAADGVGQGETNSVEAAFNSLRARHRIAARRVHKHPLRVLGLSVQIPLALRLRTAVGAAWIAALIQGTLSGKSASVRTFHSAVSTAR